MRRRRWAAAAHKPTAAAMAAVAVFALAGCGPGQRTATGPSPNRASPSASPSTHRSPSPSATPSAMSPALAQALAVYLHARAGNVSVSVYDAVRGVWYGYRPDGPHQTASVVKVSILGALLYEQQEGDVTLSTADRALAVRMVELSDNDAATALWVRAGGAQGIAAFTHRAGMLDTVPDPEHWGLTTTTTVDQATLLKTFALPNVVLSDASRIYGLSLMEHVDPSQSWGISGGVPAGVAIAIKDGWLGVPGDGWLINSVGWVSGEGRRYVIAVLSDHDPGYDSGIATIEGLSKIVWNALGP